MFTKVCWSCKCEKTIDHFHKKKGRKYGVRGECKECRAVKSRIYNSRDGVKEAMRQNWRERMSCPKNRLARRIAKGIRKRTPWPLGRNPFDYLPYTKDELYEHMVKTIPPGYSIDDLDQLHVDHIMPVSSFNFSGKVDDEFLACWSLHNLRLVTEEENRAKGTKIIPELLHA